MNISSDLCTLSGLVDLHAHPAKSGSVFGVDPDVHMLAQGTTAVGSQGDAGADNIADYVEHTINASSSRVRLAINASKVGESTKSGCFECPEDIDIDACLRAIDLHREHIWAVAVNVSHNACGETDPEFVMDAGLEIAGQANLPLLFGMRRPEDWPLADQLNRLRSGDVVTYCFRRTPHCIVKDGRVLREVQDAKQRGILFDVGHGAGSFDFEVAEMAIADGFTPDTISTDLQLRHLGQSPTHTLPLVMSKLRAVGMEPADIFQAVTSKPAELMKLGENQDEVTLCWNDVPRALFDTSGQTRVAGEWELESVKQL